MVITNKKQMPVYTLIYTEIFSSEYVVEARSLKEARGIVEDGDTYMAKTITGAMEEFHHLDSQDWEHELLKVTYQHEMYLPSKLWYEFDFESEEYEIENDKNHVYIEFDIEILNDDYVEIIYSKTEIPKKMLIDDMITCLQGSNRYHYLTFETRALYDELVEIRGG
jgi:hypothetical protein